MFRKREGRKTVVECGTVMAKTFPRYYNSYKNMQQVWQLSQYGLCYITSSVIKITGLEKVKPPVALD